MNTAITGVYDNYFSSQDSSHMNNDKNNNDCMTELNILNVDIPSSALQQTTSIQVNSALITKSNSYNNKWLVKQNSFQAPAEPLTHFEKKYAEAGKTLYHLEVDLGIRNSAQRHGLLYKLAMKL